MTYSDKHGSFFGRIDSLRGHIMLTTQAQVRAAFWEIYTTDYMHPVLNYKPGKRQNDYPTDIRVAFVDYVDSLCRSGEISEKLAHRVTL